MFSAFVNTFKIPELRRRIFYTLSLVFIARVGANIPLPGVDPQPLQDFFADQTAAGAGSLLGLYNMFTGGALLNAAVFALGIMPYISASIIFQLMTAVVPSLSRLQQEGETGRQKLTQYTRYATVVICLVQGPLLLVSLRSGALFPGFSTQEYGDIILHGNFGAFLLTGTVLLTAGTVLLMWLGERITQRGIGNGVSLLITIGILADLPGAFQAIRQLFFSNQAGVDQLGLPEGLAMVILFFLTTAGIVAVTQAVRKIQVQYAKRVVGRKVYGGQSTFLPLKVNYSGVMPVIFASAILLFFQQITSQLARVIDWRFAQQFLDGIGTAAVRGTTWYYVVFGILILLFSYFWVSMMFKPIQIADDLKKYGGYIPGVRPGEPTARFLDFTMTRLTLAGAIFLTIIAVFPDALLFGLNVPPRLSSFFGGTGMLITVGVVLDTLRQVETFLLQRHYDGFLKKGRIRGRSVGRSRQLVDSGELKSATPLWIGVTILFFAGIIAWLLRQYS